MEKQPTALQSSKMDNLLEHIKEYYDPKLQRIYERLVTIEKLLKKKVINKGNIPNKSNMLPLHTIEEFERFEELPPKELDDIVDYFIHIGGFNLRETITFIINEAMTPEVTTHFTWWGNKNKRQLFDTKLMHTIFRAVRANKNFESPDRKMFQKCVMNALQATKQKHRRATNVNDNEVTMTRHRMEQIANIVYTKPCNNNLQKARTSSGLKSKDSIVKQKHRCKTDVKDDEAKKQCRRKQIANVS
ncbi:uncharacterized protein LOC105202943 [Solenopsis invicta]|uniref:uncharacterized protein LOC105202943 n=1 Tax=Solenopsis invicta TaxID=13686 RepID=UPI000E33F63E|nr:uncharacterized protein LOC105202943 [Solenopsis invicta]